MDEMTAWILGRAPGDFIRPALLERIAGDTYRPMDRDVARENLLLFKQAMDDSQAEFYLFFGTLLGAVREGNFIAHDYDTDVAILENARPRLAQAAPKLVEAGFEFVRCKQRGRMTTFLRKGEFIDVYVARKSLRFPGRRCWDVDGALLSPGLLAEFTTLAFLGESYGVPRRPEEALAEMYGPDWRTPKMNHPAPICLDVFHPERSAALLVRKYLPRRVAHGLKRLIRRA